MLKNETEGFEFSEYDDEETDSDEFEDSREAFSDTDNPPVASDFLTPVLKSSFARNLQAKSTSTVKPALTTGSTKRSASSPADVKSRAQPQSKLPKKK